MGEAMKIINENERLREKVEEDKRKEKDYDVHLLKVSEEQAELEEQKRAKAWAVREQRIKDTMTRMADTVGKDRDAAEKALERRMLD